MHEFKWLGHLLPNGTIGDGIARANRLYWSITWWDHDGIWYVKGGEDLLLKTDSREVAEAFLYGLGLAYSVLPDGIFDAIEREVKRLVGDDDPAPPV